MEETLSITNDKLDVQNISEELAFLLSRMDFELIHKVIYVFVK